MKIIGLTGSIGMGKSTAAQMLRALKIPVFDSDACVHDLMNTDPDIIQQISLYFPSAHNKKTNKINRQELGRIVFSNDSARQTLESILHPHIWAKQREFIAKTRRARHKQIVLDIPLLFETGSDRKCDIILCVTAPNFIQQQRVLSRAGMTFEKFSSILQRQLPDTDKRKLADFLIPTGLGRAKTLQHLKKALREI